MRGVVAFDDPTALRSARIHHVERDPERFAPKATTRAGGAAHVRKVPALATFLMQCTTLPSLGASSTKRIAMIDGFCNRLVVALCPQQAAVADAERSLHRRDHSLHLICRRFVRDTKRTDACKR